MSEHNHDCNCNHDDCNCGCHNDEAVTVTLTLDNDEVVECAVLTIYEADEREYIALLPLNEDGENEDGDVFIYRYKEVDGTSKMTMSTKLLPMLLTNGLMSRILML